MDESDPLVRRLADANPVPPEETRGESLSPKADVLLAQITSGRRNRVVTRLRARRGRRLVAIVSAVAVALAGVALLLLSGEESPATASELLLRTSAIAADRKGPTGVGSYLYSRTRAEQLTTSGVEAEAWSVVVPIEEETWVAADGSGRIRSVIGDPRFLGPRDRARWRAAGSPELASGVSDDVFPAESLPYKDVSGLPTDSSELLDQLQEQVVSEELPTKVGVFLRVAELLARGDAPPELRAALYETAARLPGVQLVGETIDPIGRPGVAVAMSYRNSGAQIRVSMIFDDDTSALLAWEKTLLERAPWVDAEPGTRLSFVAYVRAGLAESIDRSFAPTSS